MDWASQPMQNFVGYKFHYYKAIIISSQPQTRIIGCETEVVKLKIFKVQDSDMLSTLLSY